MKPIIFFTILLLFINDAEAGVLSGHQLYHINESVVKLITINTNTDCLKPITDSPNFDAEKTNMGREEFYKRYFDSKPFSRYFDGLTWYETDYHNNNQYKLVGVERHIGLKVKKEAMGTDYDISYYGKYNELEEVIETYNWSEENIVVYQDFNPEGWVENAGSYKRLSQGFTIDAEKIPGLRKEAQLLDFKGDVASWIWRSPEAVEFKNMRRSLALYNLPGLDGVITAIDILEFNTAQDAFNRLLLEANKCYYLYNMVGEQFPTVEGLGDHSFTEPFCFVRGNVMVLLDYVYKAGNNPSENIEDAYKELWEKRIELAKNIDKQILDYIDSEN